MGSVLLSIVPVLVIEHMFLHLPQVYHEHPGATAIVQRLGRVMVGHSIGSLLCSAQHTCFFACADNCAPAIVLTLFATLEIVQAHFPQHLKNTLQYSISKYSRVTCVWLILRFLHAIRHSWSASSKQRTGCKPSWPPRRARARRACACPVQIGRHSASGSPSSGH